MVDYFSTLAIGVVRLITRTPLNVSRNEWIITSFCMVLIGFLCLRGFGRRDC